jgi:flagellar biosynthesis/type III secretory pathway chaperone
MTTTLAIPTTWQKIAECLRAELAEYGGLLALFEDQQKFLFDRNADEVLRLSAAIEAQMNSLQGFRVQRESTVADFAAARGQSVTSTLRSLLPLIESDARPLIEALIAEVNRLLHRVRRVSRHNHTLLARTVELHQETLRLARPDAFTQTYAPNGRVSLGVVKATPALQAAG